MILIVAIVLTTLAWAVEPVTAYRARTDRNVVTLPTLPTLPAAGGYFTDPTFGSRMLRVTDANTRTDIANGNWITSGSSEQEWNADSTKFWLGTWGGGFVGFTFDPATMTVGKETPNNWAAFGGLLFDTSSSYGDPAFSRVDRDLIYMVRQSVGNQRQVYSYRFSTQTHTLILDFDSLPIWTPAGNVSRVRLSDTDQISMTFNGTGGDTDYMAIHYTPSTGAYKVINSLTGQYYSSANPGAGWVSLNFGNGAYGGWHLHGASIDRTGRYVNFTPAGADFPVAGEPASVIYDKDESWVWDVTTDTLYKSSDFSYGHGITGAGLMVRNCCISAGGFLALWKIGLDQASIAGGTYTMLHPPKIDVPGWNNYSDVHESWLNASTSYPTPPIFFAAEELAGAYTDPSYNSPRMAWQSEILAAATDGSGLMYRFAHHRSKTDTDYYDTPGVTVSNDGRWVLFRSNWEQSLGAGPSGSWRKDVFLIDLLSAGAASTRVTGRVGVSGRVQAR